MKKLLACKTLVAFLILAGIAVAATVLFSFNVAPNSWGWGTGTVDGVTNAYIAVIPSADKPSYSNRVWVYENGSLIWSGSNVVTNQLLIATYTNDYEHTYTMIIQNTDNCTFTGKVLYD